MATQAFNRRHKIAFDYSPATAGVPSDLNEHKLADGLGKDYWFQAYLDADSQNEVLTDDGRKLINAPLRSSLIVSSSAVANTSTIATFSKKCVLRAQHANVLGAAIVVTAYGRMTTKASTPGNVGIHITLGGTRIADVSSLNGLRANVTDGTWSLQAHAKVRTAGASGAVSPGAVFATLPAAEAARPFFCAAITPIDLTADHDVEVTIDWETADVSNSAYLDDLDVLVMLPGETAS